ncbi:hypothetical protein ACTXN4_05810 [Pseudomonas helleri]|uniref:hypothetical protein n=1 Tax=Pseudomonas helleri TaxID=1608996 RepID=UPI003FD662B1
MSRGLFSSVAKSDAYKGSEKEWVVELQRYHKYWYDLVVNPGEVSEYFDTRKLIVEYLKGIKKQVEESLEKRFIYFICSRERVRFNTKKSPSYNWITKKTKMQVLVGRDKKKHSIYCKFFDVNLGRFCKPVLSLTDKYITITDSRGDLTTASVHDFLESAGIALGISSKVEYVGYTKNPHSRPTNGSHTGLSDTLHKVADDNRDSFIYFNLFKVTTHATNENSMLNFAIANAMTNEVGVELEGEILEKCFIFYFDSAGQNRNKENEFLELKSNLLKIASENKINKIHVRYEFEESSEYGIFSSSRVAPQLRHIFTVGITNGGVEIVSDS